MEAPRHFRPALNDTEYATIKAALLHWRTVNDRPDVIAHPPAELAYFAGNCGTLDLLDNTGIDALVARLGDAFIPW